MCQVPWPSAGIASPERSFTVGMLAIAIECHLPARSRPRAAELPRRPAAETGVRTSAPRARLKRAGDQVEQI
jgi:hypothetical protein